MVVSVVRGREGGGGGGVLVLGEPAWLAQFPIGQVGSPEVGVHIQVQGTQAYQLHQTGEKSQRHPGHHPLFFLLELNKGRRQKLLRGFFPLSGWGAPRFR